MSIMLCSKAEMPLESLVIATHKTPRRHPVPVIGVVYFGLTLLILHLLPTGYSVNQAVSDYALSPYGIWLDVAFFAMGIGIVLLAVSILHLNNPARFARVGVLSLLATGISFFGIGIFTTDTGGLAPVTTHGALHLVFSLIIFLSLIVGTLTLSWSFKNNELLRPYYTSSMVLGVVYTTLFVVSFLVGVMGYPGIGERASILAFYSWLLLTSVRIFRISRW